MFLDQVRDKCECLELSRRFYDYVALLIICRVYEDMRTHCTLICPDVLREEMQLGRDPGDTEGGLVSSETRLACSNMSSEEMEIAGKDRLEAAEN